MQKPSVGRIVHFHPDGPKSEPLPAIITKVWSAACVNLTVFGGAAAAEEFVSIPHNDGAISDGYDTACCWRWPVRV